MKLTARTEYALLALIHLARRPPGEPVAAPEIADAEGIPARFLHQILATLKTARVVRSTQGRHGGFELARPAAQITLAEVVRLFDGALAPTDSASPNFYHATPVEKAPRLLAVFRDIRDLVAARMEGTTLTDVM